MSGDNPCPKQAPSLCTPPQTHCEQFLKHRMETLLYPARFFFIKPFSWPLMHYAFNVDAELSLLPMRFPHMEPQEFEIRGLGAFLL